MKKILFSLLIALQFLLLLFMSVYYYILDDTGEVISLKAETYDPTDIFYGEYVNLRYAIETIPAKNWQGLSEPARNDKVYVLLEEGEDGIYELLSASTDRVEPLDNQVTITGRLEYYNDLDGIYEIDYGLNRYFIEENTGERFNNMETSLTVTVAVSSWGPKRIVSIE